MSESLMATRIEQSLGRSLTDEERYEVDAWDRGRTLAQIINTEQWQIIVDTIKAYADNATIDLLRLSPGSEHVKEAHAAAFALNDFYIKFQEDIKRAVVASQETPMILKQLHRLAVPPESL